MGKMANKEALIIGPRTVPAWIAIEEFLTDNPMEWVSMSRLLEIGVVGELQPKTVENMIRKAARIEVLRVEGRRGDRRYRLADSYTVASIVSHRAG